MGSRVSTTNNDRPARVSRTVVGGTIFVVFTVGHAVEVFGGSATNYIGTALLLARDLAAATLVACVVVTVVRIIKTVFGLTEWG